MNADPKQFERDLACYEQNCETFRSLNTTMWQVPLVAIALNGGLWWAVTAGGVSEWLVAVVLAAAALFDLAFAAVIVRLRHVIYEHRMKMKAFNPRGYVDAEGKGLSGQRVVSAAFIFALSLAAAVSLTGAAAYGLPRLAAWWNN